MYLLCYRRIEWINLSNIVCILNNADYVGVCSLIEHQDTHLVVRQCTPNLLSVKGLGCEDN